MTTQDKAFTLTVADAIPAWAQALTLKQWTAKGVNSLSSVYAADVGQYAAGPEGVLYAWNGAGFASSVGAYGSIIHWGGGHTDYWGNEIYRFDLETLTWSRINDPGTPSGSYSSDQPYGIMADGTPNATHTFYYIAANAGELFLGRREINHVPSPYVALSRCDLTGGSPAWTCYTQQPTGVDNNNGGGIVYDSTRNGIWILDLDTLGWAFWDLAANDGWDVYTGPSGAFNNGDGSVYVPTVDKVLFATATGPAIRGLDPANPSNDSIAISITGSGPSLSGTGGRMAWSSNLGGIVYCSSKASALYLLTPPISGVWTDSWSWSNLGMTGAPSYASLDAGTYAKFNICEWGAVTIATVVSDPAGSYYVSRLA